MQANSQDVLLDSFRNSDLPPGWLYHFGEGRKQCISIEYKIEGNRIPRKVGQHVTKIKEDEI